MPSGDRFVDVVNRVAEAAPLVVASRDWHPDDHCSFEAQGGPWPPHCRQGTAGAELHPGLERRHVDLVVSKGDDAARDAYSAFDRTGLEDTLRGRGVERVVVAGLATDYCVRASVLDALAAGFEVVVLEDCIGAVEVSQGDGERALAEMRERGATFARAADVNE